MSLFQGDPTVNSYTSLPNTPHTIAMSLTDPFHHAPTESPHHTPIIPTNVQVPSTSMPFLNHNTIHNSNVSSPSLNSPSNPLPYNHSNPNPNSIPLHNTIPVTNPIQQQMPSVSFNPPHNFSNNVPFFSQPQMFNSSPFQLPYSQPYFFPQPFINSYCSPHFNSFLPAQSTPVYSNNVNFSAPVTNLSSSSSISSRDRLITSISHLATLEGTSNFETWDLNLRSYLEGVGQIGYIYDVNHDPFDPSITPIFRPQLGPSPTQDKLENLAAWRQADSQVKHIILNKLSTIVSGSISMALGGSARDVYLLLRQMYSTRNWIGGKTIWDSLSRARPINGDIQSFCHRWLSDYSRICSSRFDVPAPLAISTFFHNLPSGGPITVLRCSTIAVLNQHNNVPSHYVFKVVRDLLDQVTAMGWKPSMNNSNNSNTTSHPNRQPYSNNNPSIHHNGTNNGSSSNTNPTQRRDMNTNNAIRRPQVNAAIGEEADSSPPDDGDGIDMILDSGGDDNYATANVIMPASINSDFAISFYSASDSRVDITLANDDDTFMGAFEALLDSGSTHHIFNNKDCFNSIDEAFTLPVSTANSSLLPIHGRGDVTLLVNGSDRNVRITLRGCLFAPTVPVNIISLSRLTAKGISCAFTSNGVASLSIIPSGAQGPLSIPTKCQNGLTYITCDFVNSFRSMTRDDSSFSAFLSPPLTPDLWHQRFGHIHNDATRAALTRGYVTGTTFTGTFERNICPSCVIGKGAQQSHPFRGSRTSAIGDLLHIDLCGPWPSCTPSKHLHAFCILDDYSNFGFTALLVRKSDAFGAFKFVDAFIQNQRGTPVKAVRVDGAKELSEGLLGDHFRTRGIHVQVTAPYAHHQNGKAERFIRTIEDGCQTLLAASGLPDQFWGDAVLTTQYLRNRLPTSVLPSGVTPYEAFFGKKPDLSHLRVWGCICYPIIPPERRSKAGPRRYQAIFVGYEEGRKGWRVRSLSGAYSFSSDVIFDELRPGRLGVPRSLSMPVPTGGDTGNNTRSTRNRIRTAKGEEYHKEIIKRAEQRKKRNVGSTPKFTVAHVHALVIYGALDDILQDDYLSEFNRLGHDLSEHVFLAFSELDPGPSQSFMATLFGYTKPPDDYREAMRRRDWERFKAAMDREYNGLVDMGAFEESELPVGRKAIAVRWVFAYKYDEHGRPKEGQEKARLVAKGFSQRPEDYGETYAPVARMASIRVVLALAAEYDLELFSWDCKTAFLHAKLNRDIYIRQIPGYPLANPKSVLKLKVALYGLRQAAYEFYQLLRSIMLGIGLERIEVDHAFFFGEWQTPPHPSIPMPSDGSPLRLYIPVHVDDGLTAASNPELYKWFIGRLQERLTVVDMGEAQLYLGCRIIRDRTRKTIWLSQEHFITELLDKWKMTSIPAASVPICDQLSNKKPAPPGALPSIPDEELTVSFQSIVGSLLYLAICTRPDLSYVCMALGQHNSAPTRTHMLAAKEVLRYLAGTRRHAMCFGRQANDFPAAISGYIKHGGFSDSDWASDEDTRRSVAGFCFYFLGSCVTWSAVKQKSVALSSAEAEYYALAHAVKEALWLRTLLILIHVPIPESYPVLCDNSAAITIAMTDSITSRTKHIDVRHHFLRQYMGRELSAKWIRTTEMPADIFTKPLPVSIFAKHRDTLGVRELP